MNTRVLERDYFVDKIPCMVKQRGQPVGIYAGDRLPKATLKQ